MHWSLVVSLLAILCPPSSSTTQRCADGEWTWKDPRFMILLSFFLSSRRSIFKCRVLYKWPTNAVAAVTCLKRQLPLAFQPDVIFQSGRESQKPETSAKNYRILEGGWFKGRGTREPWGTLGKLREYKGIMGITRLPTPLGPSPLKDILKQHQPRRSRPPRVKP